MKKEKKKEEKRRRKKKKERKREKIQNKTKIEHTDTTKQRKAYITLIWADDDEAGVVLAPASGSTV